MVTNRQQHGNGGAWRWVLFAAVAILAAAVIPRHVERQPGGDHILQQGVMLRVRDGTPYHEAYKVESWDRGYPLESVATWRTPALTVMLAWFPRSSSVLFVVLAVAAMVITTAMLRGFPILVMAAFLFWQTFNIPIAGPAIFYHEIWAGLLLALAVGCYAFDRNLAAAGFVLGALFIRELVLPFALLCAAVAWIRGRRRELALWIVGLIAYAAYYAMHAWAVIGVRPPDAMGRVGSYIAFGGWPAVVGTMRASAVLQLMPWWLVAVLTGLEMVALTARRVPTHLRLLVATYIAVFAVVGYSFNGYWGWMLSPVLPVLAVLGARALVPSLGRRQA